MVKKLQRKETLKKIKPVIWFFIIFNVLSIPMHLAIYMNFSIASFQIFLTNLSHRILDAFGYSSELVEHPLCPVKSMKFPELTKPVCISWDSTGWKSLYLICALSFATPLAGYHKKSKFIILGVPTIFVLNILRITTTIAISINFGEQYFEVIHTLLWREALIFAILGIWFIWLWKERHNII